MKRLDISEVFIGFSAKSQPLSTVLI